MKHLNIRVRGMVQGVFFRSSTRETARALGLSGFVRNERDGSVYIEAEGDDDALQQLVAWCRRGPPSAIVDDVQVTEGAIEGFGGFGVRF
jgi:acylphosphatase